MMNPKEQEHLNFLWLYSIDFNSALHILRVLENQKDPQDKSARYYLLAALVVTYGRSFSGNEGNEYKGREKHRLKKEDVVPNELHDLHDKLQSYRNRQFAHSDMTYYNLRIVNMSGAETAWTANLRGCDYEFLDQNVMQIEKLIKSVEGNCNALLEEALTRLPPE